MNKMEEFLQRLTLQGIHLWPQEGKLRCTGPQHRITPEVLRQLKTHKTELLQQLNEPSYAPLSVGQRGLWFIQQQAPENSAYTVTVAYRIHTAFDIELLRDTIQLLVNRHAALRIRFTWQAETLVQQIDGYQAAAIEVMDHTDYAEAALQQQLQAFHERPFDLSSGPLLRTAILRHGEQSYTLMLSVHHIVVDGWSIYQLIDELFTFYAALRRGAVVELPIIEHTYADYVGWQQRLLEREGAQLLAYWQSQLGGELPVLQLPTDFPRPRQQTLRGISQPLHLSPMLTAQLKQMARQNHCTLYMLLLAAYQVLLHRYSGQTDILVGLPMSGRSQPEFAEIIGYFVSPVVVRAKLLDNPTFVQVLASVKEQVLAALDHQDYPFVRLVEHLNPQRDPSRSPIFQASFVLQKPHRAQVLMQQTNTQEQFGLRLEPISFTLFAGQDDIAIELIETSDGLVGDLAGNAALFSPETLARMAGHYQVLLAGIVAEYSLGVNQPIAQLPLLTEVERHQLLVEWNATQTDYPKDKCIHHLFEEQVTRTPDAVAVVMAEDNEARRQGDKETALTSIQNPKLVLEGSKIQNHLTYAELNARANQLAHYLQTLGVGPEVLVGICVERSIEMVVGLLAILKAGGAYVPLDPTYPKERLAFMLQDAAVPVLLTQSHLRAALPAMTAQVVCLDTDWAQIVHYPTTTPVRQFQPDHIAYVIYTSGSTGQPKGVMIEHQAVVKHLTTVTKAYQITAQDRVLQFASFSFDVAQEQILTTLSSGATLIIRDNTLWSYDVFNQQVSTQGITVADLPPAYLQQLLNGWLTERPNFLTGQLRLILVGGERVQPEIVTNWLQLAARQTRLINVYGPTETTITATFFDLTDYQPMPLPINLPIGRSLSGRKAYIFDAALQPVPIGVAGELYIGGNGLARGYLNRPELTMEKFITNPFGEGKLYKTGDLCRWLPDSNLEYLGRIDQQVKIRGFRIELGEIEAMLAQHPAVQEAVVIAHEDIPGEKRLVAYLVQDATYNLQPATLRSHLQAKLPEYMLPSAFVLLDALPLTPNGKVDRKALPLPDQTSVSNGYEAPRTDTERVLCAIYQDVLKVNSIGIHDNFFELGGHSLLLIQMKYRVEQSFTIELPVNLLFKYPTPATLGSQIDRLRVDPADYKSVEPQTRSDWRAEMNLDASIYPPTTCMVLSSELPKTIFITGATGFLGSYLLHDLLQATSAQIYCLVRATDMQEAKKRLRHTLEQYQLWQDSFHVRLVPVLGDLSQPRFGLSPAEFEHLATCVDVIYHNGANVNFIYSYSMLKAANVLSTQEVLRLACQIKPKAVHYISTVSVFPIWKDIYDEADLLRLDDLNDEDLNPQNGYSLSKWVAEKLITEAHERGLPTRIYRPSYIGGDSKTGLGNLADFQTRELKGCLQEEIYPNFGEYFENLVPVDYVSQAIVHLSCQPLLHDRIFHITNPINHFLDLVYEYAMQLGYPLRRLEWADWREQIMGRLATETDHPLYPFLPLYARLTPQEIEKYSKRVEMRCQNTLAGLSGTRVVCPSVDEKLLARYFSYWIKSGLLLPPPNTTSI
jgi:amino acid adenylation domain-containing protein/thioester reductase-like protein